MSILNGVLFFLQEIVGRKPRICANPRIGNFSVKNKYAYTKIISIIVMYVNMIIIKYDLILLFVHMYVHIYEYISLIIT